MKNTRQTPMKPIYHKIPGTELTEAQKKMVERAIHPKYEPSSGGWIRSKTFYFSGQGRNSRFIGVFE